MNWYKKSQTDIYEDEEIKKQRAEEKTERFCSGIDPSRILERDGNPPSLFLLNRGDEMMNVIRNNSKSAEGKVKMGSPFFSMLSIKADGSPRVFSAQMGVKYMYNPPGTKYKDYRPYDPERKQLYQEIQKSTGTIRVWEENLNKWSTVILDNIEAIKSRGNVYIVKDPTIPQLVKVVSEAQQLSKIPIEKPKTIEEIPSTDIIGDQTKEKPVQL